MFDKGLCFANGLFAGTNLLLYCTTGNIGNLIVGIINGGVGLWLILQRN